MSLQNYKLNLNIFSFTFASVARSFFSLLYLLPFLFFKSPNHFVHILLSYILSWKFSWQCFSFARTDGRNTSIGHFLFLLFLS